MPQLMLIGNPKRRSGAKRRRSPAQKAATRRMLAANRARKNPAARKRRRTARRSVAVAGPVRRTARRSVRRSARRSFSGMTSGIRASGALGLVKAGAIGGAGAVAVDIAFGQAGRILPAGWVSPMNADGSTNWLYFAAKAGAAVALGMYGRKVMPAPIAAKMAEGSLTVLSYQIMRGMIPASIGLGYYNPVPVMSQPRPGMGAYLPRSSGMGAYQALNRAAMNTPNNGANVARILAR